jgi:DNA-binding transcriptional regulator YhcF (GntR family)
MNFKDSKAIYLQIAERIEDEIVQGTYVEDSRIPSVREYAMLVEVNANTVMRSFDYLQSQEIIYNKRGLGYFVAQDARTRIITLRQTLFLNEKLPHFFSELQSLDISIQEIKTRYQAYIKEQTKLKK